jgi:hypothetical protein
LPEYQGFAVKLGGVLQYQDPTTNNSLPGQTG